MAKVEKRARKKRFRDELLAERKAALRRRRMFRGALAAGVVAGIVFVALSSGDDAGREGASDASPSPTADTASVACGGQEPAPADPQEYRKAPPQRLDPGVDYRAIIQTSCGDIEIDLLEDVTPVTVNNFIFLAEEGFYDGTTWHRIEQNFVIQAGDPNGQNGTPPDGPGYAIDDELPEKPNQYVFGTVAMANSGPNTSGSQFFIITHTAERKGRKVYDEPAGLQPLYSIFGEVAKRSYGVVEQIAKLETVGGTDPVESVKPVQTVYVERITIIKG